MVVRPRLAHASSAFTRKRYGHVLRGLEEQAAEALPDATALGTN